MQICICRFNRLSVSDTRLPSQWMWWILIEKGYAHAPVSWLGSRPLWLWNLTSHMLNNKLQMTEGANSYCWKETQRHVFCFYHLTAVAASVAQRTIPEHQLIHLPMAHRALQQSSSLKAFPSSLLEILFNTIGCIPLAKYCLDQKACCFLRPLLCPLQVFLGADQHKARCLFELVFQILVCKL